MQLDAGLNRVIGVNNWGEIFARDTATGTPGEVFTDEWTQINGRMKQVTTSQNHVSWGVDTANTLWFYAEHPTGTPDNPLPIPPEETDWLPVHYAAEKMNDLDVGRDGMVWGCTASNKIIYRAGITADEISGTEWKVEDVAERCASVAVCTSGHVWAITPQGGALFRTGIMASTFDQDLIGTGWTDQDLGVSFPVSEVACGGNRQVWMTSTDGKLYHKTNTQDFTRPQGDDLEIVDDGNWSSISVGENGQVFGLRNGKACARIGYDVDNTVGNAWSEFDTSMTIKNFNAGNNEIWMVNLHHEVYRRTGVDHAANPWETGVAWEAVAGPQAFVATAEEGITWAIDAEGEVWRWKQGLITIEQVIDNVAHEWEHIAERQLIRVDVGGPTSTVVGIEQGGNALFRTGVKHDSPKGDNWAELGTGFTDITACRNRAIWATDGQTV